jgi:hypothetical protein
VSGKRRGFWFVLLLHLAMAAFDLAMVVSLTVKAKELSEKGHFERCLEKWRAALVAVEAIGAEDCVLVAQFRTEVARVVFEREFKREGPCVSQATILQLLDTYAAAAASLRRRRDAGTLLPGKCRPIEEQWLFKFLTTRPSEVVSRADPQRVRARAELVGYDAFLSVCGCVMGLRCMTMGGGSLERGGEAEHAFFSFVCDLCDDTVALMVQPRVEEYGSAIECAIVKGLMLSLQMLEAIHAPQVWCGRVSLAVARLRESGVVEKRHLGNENADRLIADMRGRQERVNHERAAAAASGLLKSCALAGCGAKEAHVSHFGKCGSCKTVAYCCRDHQLADWQTHKAACKAARKAAAAAKDAA